MQKLQSLLPLLGLLAGPNRGSVGDDVGLQLLSSNAAQEQQSSLPVALALTSTDGLVAGDERRLLSLAASLMHTLTCSACAIARDLGHSTGLHDLV